MSLWHYFRDVFPPRPSFLPKDYPDLTGKTVLVTGTSAGIGKSTLKLLLSKNATVVCFNRSKDKTEKVNEEIKSELISSNPELNGIIDSRIIPIYADLSDLTTIKSAVEEINSKINELNIVILNAGVMLPPTGSVTKQGYELQIGTNVIGHQLLLDLINPLILNALKDSVPRVIFLSSAAHLSSPKDGIDFERGFKDASNTTSIVSYGQSKAGNIYQAFVYGQDNPEVISLAVHPGYLVSELGRSLPSFANTLYGVFYAPIYGSYTELFAALSPEITIKHSRKYVAPWGYFRPVRQDIQDGATNGNARKLVDLVETEIKPFK